MRADYYFGESTFGSATQGNERMWNNSLNDVNTVVSNFGNLYEVINQANLMINKVEGMYAEFGQADNTADFRCRNCILHCTSLHERNFPSG